VAGDGKVWSSALHHFLDYDSDGHLDLLVTSYQAFDLAKPACRGNGGRMVNGKGCRFFAVPRGLPLRQRDAVSQSRIWELKMCRKGSMSFNEGFYALPPWLPISTGRLD